MIKMSLFLVCVLWMMLGCQFLSKNEDTQSILVGNSNVGRWEAKVMIKSLETGEANIVSLDVLAKKPNSMRAEITTSMGIALASIVMRDQEIEYIVPKQKKYFSGPISEESLLPVLKVKVDPRILAAALFEEALSNWECKADHGFISTCSTPDGIQLNWNREDKEARRVSISSVGFDVQMQIKKFTPKSEFPAKSLVLKVPDSYKKYRLKVGPSL